MTRRERMETRADKREEWAGKARQTAAQKFKAADAAVEGIPFGQPILTDHYSAPRHRAAIKKCETNMRAGIERVDMAHRHEQVADTLRDNLDRSIFSDDENAIAALEKRIAEREAERDRIKRYNASCRKNGGAGDRSILDASQQSDLDSITHYAHYQLHKGALPAYVLSNLAGRIKADRDRIETIKRRAAQTERAEAAGGVLIREYMPGRVLVVFAEKPERSILNALKAAGFFWSGGAWNGMLEKLPAEIQA